MDFQDSYQICLNGHGINASYYRNKEANETFCTTCGASTIHQCPNCSRDIDGERHYDGIFVAGSWSEPVPQICKHCGTDFPWRTEQQDALTIGSSLAKKSDTVIIMLFVQLHRVAKKLEHRYSNRSTLKIGDEYDVQDLLGALLVIYFDDVRAEEWNPSYAGASTRSDFLLKEEKIVIEVKKTRKGLADKQIGEQLIIDIEKYRTHPDCDRLYCFVYDPEDRIRNPRAIEGDLSGKRDGIDVLVVIQPKR